MRTVSEVSDTQGDVGRQENHSSVGKRSWGKTKWLCRHLPGAHWLCPLRWDRWMVFGSLLLTSAPFPPPPWFYIPLSPAGIVHSPQAPHRSISWCSGALKVPARSSPSSPFSPVLFCIHTTRYRMGAAGHRRLSWASSNLFHFFKDVFWPLSSEMEGRRGCPFDF